MAKWGEGRSKERGEKGEKEGKKEGRETLTKVLLKYRTRAMCYVQILSLSQPVACLIAVTTSPHKPSYLGTSVT